MYSTIQFKKKNLKTEMDDGGKFREERGLLLI